MNTFIQQEYIQLFKIKTFIMLQKISSVNKLFYSFHKNIKSGVCIFF